MASGSLQDEPQKKGPAVRVDPYGRTYDENGNYVGPAASGSAGYSHGAGPASGGLISTKLNYENIGPNAEALRPIDNTAQHDYLRDIGQFSSRIPGLINSAGGPGNINTFGSDNSIYGAIQNRANENFNIGLKDFKNKLNREEYQMQDKLLGYEMQKTQASLAYHSMVEQKKKAMEAARKAKRAQVIGSVLSIYGAVMGNSQGLQQNASEW